MALAVLAGIAESVITAVGFLGPEGAPDGWQIQLGIRALVYTVAFILIGLTWQGRRAAHWLLLIMLGVVGLGSLVVPLIGELAQGTGPIEAMGGSWAFAVTRTAHIALVVVGAIALLVQRPVRQDLENRRPEGVGSVSRRSWS
jgi:hypothetical protein